MYMSDQAIMSIFLIVGIGFLLFLVVFVVVRLAKRGKFKGIGALFAGEKSKPGGAESNQSKGVAMSGAPLDRVPPQEMTMVQKGVAPDALSKLRDVVALDLQHLEKRLDDLELTVKDLIQAPGKTAAPVTAEKPPPASVVPAPNVNGAGSAAAEEKTVSPAEREIEEEPAEDKVQVLFKYSDGHVEENPDVKEVLAFVQKKMAGDNHKWVPGDVKVPPNDYGQIRERVAKGESTASIALQYGCSERTIKKILSQMEAAT